MQVKLFSFKPFEKPEFELANKQFNFNLHFSTTQLNEESAARLKNIDAVSIFSNDNASESVLKLLKQNGVKYIALRSAGYNHVDLYAAEQLGLKVANVPAYSPHAIAEHAVALLLAINRKLIIANKRIALNDFSLDGLTGFDLYGKTAGIVGTGKTGAIVAEILKAFGCKILGYDINHDESLIAKTGITYTDLKTLCKLSDVISIHVPLNKHTRYVIDESCFNLMKPHALVVNTARGAVVNTQHLIEALLYNKIAAYGMDVYEKEEGVFFYDYSKTHFADADLLLLKSLNNVVITAHQAFLTQEALHGIANTTLQNLNSWHTSGICANELKP